MRGISVIHMTMKRFVKCLRNTSYLLPIGLVLFLQIASGQEPTPNLLLARTLPIDVRADNRRYVQVAYELLLDARVAGGVVDGSEDATAGDLVIPEGMPLGDALTSLLGGQRQIVWLETGGVVNVLPQRGIPALLKTNVSFFEWKSDESPYAVVSKLDAVPEVVRSRSLAGYDQAPHMVPGLQKAPRIGVTPAFPETPQVFVRRNVMLYNLLNEIVKSYPTPALWMYSETRNGAGHAVSLFAN